MGGIGSEMMRNETREPNSDSQKSWGIGSEMMRNRSVTEGIVGPR